MPQLEVQAGAEENQWTVLNDLAMLGCHAPCVYGHLTTTTQSYYSSADHANDDHDLMVDAELSMMAWLHVELTCRVFAECHFGISECVSVSRSTYTATRPVY